MSTSFLYNFNHVLLATRYNFIIALQHKNHFITGATGSGELEMTRNADIYKKSKENMLILFY